MEGNAVSGGEDPGLFPTAGTIPTMPPLATVVESEGGAACAIVVEFWIELLAPGIGSESNAVSDGDEPGLFPMAGTMPTIPDTAGNTGLKFVEVLPLPTAVFGATEVVEVVGAASCGLMSDAATVASGFPLGSTNVISPVGVAALLCPLPSRWGDLLTRDTGGES